MKKMKEKMPPSKKMQKPGKIVKGIKYSEDLENMTAKVGKKMDNKPSSRPNDISGALMRAKEGYSKKPRVIPQRKK